MSEAPIDDCLDELLRRTRADARTTRRLLDEASDHLRHTAADLVGSGMSAQEAETEAVRRFGPITPIARATSRASLATLAVEASRAGLFLAGCGLAAVGVSGLVALVMNVWAGKSFVGGRTVFLGPGPGPSVQEVADDAVVLRVLAGLIGVLMLLAYLAWRRHSAGARLLPAVLVDAVGAAAFAAGAAALTIASVDQAVQTGTPGVGFPLSGALVAFFATAYFGVRTARRLLTSNS